MTKDQLIALLLEADEQVWAARRVLAEACTAVERAETHFVNLQKIWNEERDQ